jgi:hypothetical protein
LGNDNFELRIDLEDFEGRTENVTYSTFNIGDASTKYKLTIGGYSGTLGIIKDLYCREDTNLVFSRFISRGKVVCYNQGRIYVLATTEQKLIHSF